MVETDTLIRYRLTTHDFHKMAEAGIFPKGKRVELIDGELIAMAPIGIQHASVVRDLINTLAFAVKGVALVDAQNPVVLDEHTEPQPDVILLRLRADGYRIALPKAEDVLLLIEVADTSAESDRSVKIPLYARHGIPEVWLIDLKGKVLEVYRDPQSQHEDYQHVEHWHGGIVTAAKVPVARIDVNALLR